MKGIHMVPVMTPTLLPAVTTNVYIFENNGSALIIDSGYDDEKASQEIIDKVEELGIERIVGLVLTHFHRDHSKGTKHIVRQFQCPVICHPLERDHIEKEIFPITVQATVEDGDHIQVGKKVISIIHTPGHTPGHLSLWWKEEGVLFTGDNIVGEGTTWIGPPDGNLVQYLDSLNRLYSLQPRLIAPGHGPWVTNPLEKIKFVIDRRMERENQIVQFLKSAACTSLDLVQKIYQDTIPPSSYWAAERTIIGHLEKLMEENKVCQDKENGKTLYRLKG